MQNRSIKLNSPPKLCCINWSEKWPLIKQININIAIAGMTVELQMAEWCDAGLSRTNSSQAKWIRVRKLKAGWKSWDFQERLIVYMQQNDPNHRLFIAGFDWPPALSLGKNLGPLSDGSVSDFVPRLKQLRPAPCFHMGIRWGRRGRRWTEKGGVAMWRSHFGVAFFSSGYALYRRKLKPSQ